MTAPDPIRVPYERPVISASRLVAIGGEKGAPGCERKLGGQYLFGMKQASSDALEFGSALHENAEHFQATGEIPDPEGDVARVLVSGAHLINTCGKLRVEWEHRGTFPDGSPYVAFLDGGSAEGHPQTSSVVIQDLKTTSNPHYALVADPESEYALRKHPQAMMYAWILLCDVHWTAPSLPHGHIGPQQWEIWDPVAKRARTARLRWLYFLTKGVARAWDVSDFVTPAAAEAYLDAHIMPLVAKINALHEWHYSKPGATLNEIDRNLGACRGKGMWCGAGVDGANACDFSILGTPALDLVQLKVRKMTSPQDRLAALRNRTPGAALAATPAPAPSAVEPTPAPKAPEPTPPVAAVAAPVVTEAQPASDIPAPESSSTTPAAELSRGQKAAATRAANAAARASATPPTTTPGAGINPPEVVEALAKLTAEGPSYKPAPALPTERAAAEHIYETSLSAISGLTVTELCDLLIKQGYTVQLTRDASSLVKS